MNTFFNVSAKVNVYRYIYIAIILAQKAIFIHEGEKIQFSLFILPDKYLKPYSAMFEAWNK